ncbi:MAG TPA: hypothetical protein VF169_23750 [Albitalea sp.]
MAMPAAVPKCGRTVVQGSCPTSRKCEIKVTVEGSIPVVDPETANVSGSGKLRIIWHLPVGYEFDRDQGDGVQFYVPKTQFQQDYATDDAGGADQGKRKGRHFHWRFENTEKAKYGYAVQFRKGSTVYKCDPTINNEGG